MEMFYICMLWAIMRDPQLLYENEGSHWEAAAICSETTCRSPHSVLVYRIIAVSLMCSQVARFRHGVNI